MSTQNARRVLQIISGLALLAIAFATLIWDFNRLNRTEVASTCLSSWKVTPLGKFESKTISDGIVYVQGTPAKRGESISNEDFFEIQLCSKQRLNAVQIQFEGKDLEISFSEDGLSFHSAGVLSGDLGHGLHTRATILPQGSVVQALRIEPVSDKGTISVGEILIYSDRSNLKTLISILVTLSIAILVAYLIFKVFLASLVFLPRSWASTGLLAFFVFFTSLISTYIIFHYFNSGLSLGRTFFTNSLLHMITSKDYVYSEDTAQLGKLIIAATCVPLMILYAPNRQNESFLKMWRGLLLTIVVLGIGNYYHFNWDFFSKKIDPVDVAHYYLGAKYFDELGYDNLYEAALIADVEQGGYFQSIKIRSFRGEEEGSMRTLGTALRMRDQIVARFSTDRWGEFKSDLDYLKRAFEEPAEAHWKSFFDNRGYNATPFGNFVLRLVTNQVPIEKVKLICLLDVALIVLSVALVVRRFGFDIGLVYIVFLTCTFSARWPTLGSSLLRTDWVVCLTAALCSLQAGKSFLSGILTAIAASLRIFPGGFAFWFFAKGFFDLVILKSWRTESVRFIVGFLVALFACLFIVFIVDGGQSIIGSYRNMSVHLQSKNLTSQRVGLGVALAYRGETTTRETHSGDNWIKKGQLVEELKPVRYLIAFSLLGVILLYVRKIEGITLFGLGFIPIFFLTIGSYYYFIMRVVLIPFHMATCSTLISRFGLPFLFFIEAFCLYYHELTKHRYSLTAIMSVLLAIYCLTLILLISTQNSRTHLGGVGR